MVIKLAIIRIIDGLTQEDLQILCVWPAYWRQGAGGMLVKWGCDMADQINATCVVESSGAGKRLYEKWGFELQEDFVLDVDEKFSDRKSKGSVRFMVRPSVRSRSASLANEETLMVDFGPGGVDTA
jgi:GNAT superfamily N-acetyltransferase